jgi:hypothetical protein
MGLQSKYINYASSWWLSASRVANLAMRSPLALLGSRANGARMMTAWSGHVGLRLDGHEMSMPASGKGEPGKVERFTLPGDADVDAEGMANCYIVHACMPAPFF